MKSIYHNKYKKETRRIVNEIKRYIISKMINDLISETKKYIFTWSSESSDDVRKMKKPLVTFSKEMKSIYLKLEVF